MHMPELDKIMLSGDKIKTPNKGKEGFLSTDICKECKGRCYKQMGCAFSPDDFEKIGL